MSLIALIATSVSAYAVSSRNFAPGAWTAGLLEHLDAGHLRHPLVGGDQRHRLVAQGELGQHVQRLCSRRRAHDPVVGAVLPRRSRVIAAETMRVVVDGQDGRLAHGISPPAPSQAPPRRLEERENRQTPSIDPPGHDQVVIGHNAQAVGDAGADPTQRVPAARHHRPTGLDGDAGWSPARRRPSYASGEPKAGRPPTCPART